MVRSLGYLSANTYLVNSLGNASKEVSELFHLRGKGTAAFIHLFPSLIA